MPLLTYLGHASLFLACLYSAYWLLFHREAFHQLNRLILLLIIAATLALPKVPAPALFQNKGKNTFSVSDWLPVPSGGTTGFPSPAPGTGPELQPVGGASGHLSDASFFSISQWLILAYFIGLVLLAARFALQLYLALRFLSRSSWEKDGSGWLASSSELSTPFSFWNVIFLPEKYKSSPLQEFILAHERVHRRQWHSADLLLAELFCIAFWFHPAAWRLNRALRAKLEHIADEAALDTGLDPRSYQFSLLRLASKNSSIRLANQFNQSLIKTRIVMMNTRKSPEHYKLKYLAVLPLFSLLVLAFNDARAQAEETQPAKTSVGVHSANGPSGTAVSDNARGAVAIGSGSSATAIARSSGGAIAVGPSSSSSATSGKVNGSGQAETPYESVFVAIGAEFPVERLPQLEKDLKEQGILLNIEELDYNPDKLITRIKLSVRTTDGRMHGNGFSYNDGQPIDEPVIFYVRRDEGNYGFGIFSGKPGKDVPAEVRSVVGKMENGYFVGKIIME